MVINPNDIHEVHSYEKVFFAEITIDYAAASRCFDHHRLAFSCNSSEQPSHYYDGLRQIIRRLLGYSQSVLKQDSLMKEALGNELIYILIQHFLAAKAPAADGNVLPAQGEARVHSLLQYIMANYKNPLTLTDTARQLYLSPAYLSRYFKQHFGMGFLSFVNNIRLDHACRDLVSTKKSITKIAMDNGFPSPAGFIRTFKAAYHMTPSQYREKFSDSAKGFAPAVSEEMTAKLSTYLHQNEVLIHTDKSFDAYEIHASLAQGPRLHHSWNQMINGGPLKLFLRQDMRSQILDLTRSCGFKYVRISNIFSDSRMLKNAAGYSDYNFNEVDQVLDFFVENNITPYIQLCNRAYFIYRNLKKVLAYENDFDLIKFVQENPQIIDRFVSHLLFRYGRDVMKDWYIEFEGCGTISESKAAREYFKTLSYIYHCFKSRIPEIRVGGPGFSPNYHNPNMEETLLAWKDFGCLPDFMSMYLYLYEPISPDAQAGAAQEEPRLYSRSKNLMREELAAMKRRLETLDITIPELHVSQWNSSLSERSSINDSCQKAACIMHHMLSCSDMAGVFGYTTASDIPSELYDAKQPLFGGGGLLSCSGIHKPAYYAYYFLNKLENTLLFKNENIIITAGADGHIVLCCHNYKHYNFKYYFMDEDRIFPENQEQYYENHRSLELTVTLTDLANGTYSKKAETVNHIYGNIQHAWEDMDYEANLTSDELQYLKAVAQPHITIEKMNVSGHSLQFKIRLAPQEIQCIQIRRYES